MTWVSRSDRGTASVELSSFERMFLAGLLDQLVEVLQSDSDPALDRLLPNAYPDDDEAAAEFRRFTAAGLTERKVANAQAVRVALDSGLDPAAKADARVIVVQGHSAEQWLSTLTDLRLTIANRLGIESDDDEGRTDVAAMPLQESYYWLGDLQEMIVRALDD
ncbi:DUF2017 family protein [Glaciibacter sp. 2TAF33]|uniref:DUF2017 family protein n=1 Tax=Glaciibacter sp. 2TAF33 TaxID=3233015 RepID=UPI003F910A4B